MTLLNELVNITFKENFIDEGLVSLRKLKGITIDETKYQIANKSEYFCYVRESIYIMLVKAVCILPSGFQFYIKEGYRPATVQRNSFDRVHIKYKADYPEKNVEEIYKSVSQYVAPINVAGHPTGGAIDITLMEHGKEVFMGTNYNDEPEKTGDKTYLYTNNINQKEKKLREIFSNVLSEVGFINYPPEWWHWSFGDKYWSFITKLPVRYRIIEDDEIINLTNAST